MKFSFLVNFEAFSLQPNSFTGIVLVFFVPLILKSPMLKKISWCLLPFYTSFETCKPPWKPLKNRTNENEEIFTNKRNSFASNNLLRCFRNKTLPSMWTWTWCLISILVTLPKNICLRKSVPVGYELETTSWFYNFMLWEKWNWWFRVYFALWL